MVRQQLGRCGREVSLVAGNEEVEGDSSTELGEEEGGEVELSDDGLSDKLGVTIRRAECRISY